MKKWLLFLATEKGFVSLNELVRENALAVGCVITFFETGVEKNWEPYIRNLCIENDIPCLSWKDARNDMEGIISRYRITGAIAISWRYIIPLQINDFLKERLIIIHDSLLPRYRGFAPTATAIIAGDDEVGITALFAAEAVDAGGIIFQERIRVPRTMYMADIIHCQSHIYAKILQKIVGADCLPEIQQDESRATYSIWRDESDCHIDWEQSSEKIYNLIRACGSPYPGAFSYIGNQKIRILEAETSEEKKFEVRDCGKIWKIHKGIPEIVCGSGMLRIIKAEDENHQKYLFSKVRERLR